LWTPGGDGHTRTFGDPNRNNKLRATTKNSHSSSSVTDKKRAPISSLQMAKIKTEEERKEDIRLKSKRARDRKKAKKKAELEAELEAEQKRQAERKQRQLQKHVKYNQGTRKEHMDELTTPRQGPAGGLTTPLPPPPVDSAWVPRALSTPSVPVEMRQPADGLTTPLPSSVPPPPVDSAWVPRVLALSTPSIPVEMRQVASAHFVRLLESQNTRATNEYQITVEARERPDLQQQRALMNLLTTGTLVLPPSHALAESMDALALEDSTDEPPMALANSTALKDSTDEPPMAPANSTALKDSTDEPPMMTNSTALKDSTNSPLKNSTDAPPLAPGVGKKVLYLWRSAKATEKVIGFQEGVLANGNMTQWANSVVGKHQRENFDYVDLPISERLMDYRGSQWLRSTDLTLLVAMQALSSRNKNVIFDKYEAHLQPKEIKLPASVKRISAFANFGMHWFRIRIEISSRRVLVHESVPAKKNAANPERLGPCIRWFLRKYSLPHLDRIRFGKDNDKSFWTVEIQTDVEQPGCHSCGPITAMIMWRDADSKSCPLKKKNGPRLDDYRKILLDQLCRNMRTLGLLAADMDSADDIESIL
jgi:hypothetical protein